MMQQGPHAARPHAARPPACQAGLLATLRALSNVLAVALLSLGLAVLGERTAAAADVDAATYFKGKTIRFVVDFKPGGGTDVQARYFAAKMGKFIPGKPKLTVTNLFPNPAGRNYMWKSAPDGLTLSFVASAGVGDELVDPAAQFKTEKFTWIGSHAKRDVVLLVRGTLPYNSLLDAKGGKVQITIAEPVGSAEDLHGKLLGVGMLALWFDVPLRIVTVAASGLADELLMIERGDVNAYIAGSHWYSLPTLRPGWFAKGFVKPIADLGHPDVPSVANSEIAMSLPNVITWLSDEQKELWQGLYLPEVLSGKGIAGPPKMSADVAKVLRDAYANALGDAEFASGLEKIQGQPIALIRGEKMQELVVASARSFEKQLPRYNDIRQQVYDRYFRQASIAVVPDKFKGKIAKVENAGRMIVIDRHSVKISGSRSTITVDGKPGDRKSLEAGMSCAVNGGMRKGAFEATRVDCTKVATQ